MPISKEDYGQLATGERVTRYTLTNRHGLILKVINYGAIITELHVPDRAGKFADVVLGLPSLPHYLAGHPYCGAMVGRTAGRINGAQFELDGEHYQLTANQPPNNLHGGVVGFDKKLWEAESFENALGEQALCLRCTSPDGEEGFPGNLQMEVIYTLTDGNALRMESRAWTDRRTPFAPTNHSYFNLAGAGSGNIGNHWLEIAADSYAATDGNDSFIGELCPVAGLPVDFRESVLLHSRISQPDDPHGAMFCIQREKPGAFVRAARLVEPLSGRTLEVFTNESYLNTYTGKFLYDDRFILKDGMRCPNYAGLALECQSFPNSVSMPRLAQGAGILSPSEDYKRTTEYRFGLTTLAIP